MKAKHLTSVTIMILLLALCCFGIMGHTVCIAEEAHAVRSREETGTACGLSYILVSDSEGACTGHWITGGYRVVVTSGSHQITLSHASNDASVAEGDSAIEVQPGASVRLTLDGENYIYTDSAPGIRVAAGGSLTIDEQNEGLLQIGTLNNPCISGGQDDFGRMTLESGQVQLLSYGMHDAFKVGSGSLRVTGGDLMVLGGIYGSGMGAALTMEKGSSLRVEGGRVAIGSDSQVVVANRGGEIAVDGGTLIVARSENTINSISLSGAGTIHVRSGSMQVSAELWVKDDAAITVSGGSLRCFGRDDDTLMPGMCIMLQDRSGMTVTGGTVSLVSARTDTESIRLTAPDTFLSISGGDVSISSAEDGIVVTDGRLDISGGSLSVSCSEVGINSSMAKRRAAVQISGGRVLIIGRDGIYVPKLTISGGTVEAEGNDGNGLQADYLEILDGDVTAKTHGKSRAGIAVSGSCTLIIRGGRITASGDPGAGIGSAYDSFGSIVIEGGEIVATGSGDAAGIATGGINQAGTLSITGGEITATGGADAPGIGCGWYRNAGRIEISGGQVTSIGGVHAAGIGGGTSAYSGSDQVSISGGTVCLVSGREAESAVRAQMAFTGGSLSIDGVAQEPQAADTPAITP